MSKFFHLAKKSRKIYNRQNKLTASMFKLKIINATVLTFIVVFAVSYLIQINGLATKGYQIQELEEKIVVLEQQQSELELEALNLQSMGTIKEKVDDLGLVVVNETDYLTDQPVALAP